MRQNKRVGIVVRPTRTYCRRIVDGIVAVGAQYGWEHVLVPINVAAALGGFGKDFVDGYIGHFSEQALVEQVQKSGIPSVDISSCLPDSTLPRVITDEVAVGRVAAAYLLSLGLPHFGFVGSADDYCSSLRAKGFEQALTAAGHTFETFLDHSAIDDEAGLAPPIDLQNWVAKLSTPVGIFASSDLLGLQLLALCGKLKIAVPKDAVVVGVGNDELFCNISNPPLTSIALATQRIGFDGAQMLARLMDGKKLAQSTVLISPVAVIARQSSALPAIVDRDVAAAVSYIALHAKDGLRVMDVLRTVPVSRSSLDQRFMKALGRTPATAIRQAQVELAKKMLSETQEQMPQVAAASGFHDGKQLSVTFRREVGMTPMEYRRQNRPSKTSGRLTSLVS
jgi:LacI family transcriptional regulator